jgi:uncharacterized protein YqgC (DUF456 family)
VLSTLVGVCLGTFLGAMTGELAMGRHVGRSAWIGFGAARGRLVGTFVKLGFGVGMAILTLVMGLPIGGPKKVKASAKAVTTTAPTTQARH